MPSSHGCAPLHGRLPCRPMSVSSCMRIVDWFKKRTSQRVESSCVSKSMSRFEACVRLPGVAPLVPYPEHPSGPTSRQRPSRQIPPALTQAEEEEWKFVLCDKSPSSPSWPWRWPAWRPYQRLVLEAAGGNPAQAARPERGGAGRAAPRQRGDRCRVEAASAPVVPLHRVVPRPMEAGAVAGRLESAGHRHAGARCQPAARPRRAARLPPVEPVAPAEPPEGAERRARAVPPVRAALARRRGEPGAARAERRRRIPVSARLP